MICDETIGTSTILLKGGRVMLVMKLLFDFLMWLTEVEVASPVKL